MKGILITVTAPNGRFIANLPLNEDAINAIKLIIKVDMQSNTESHYLINFTVYEPTIGKFAYLATGAIWNLTGEIDDEIKNMQKVIKQYLMLVGKKTVSIDTTKHYLHTLLVCR